MYIDTGRTYTKRPACLPSIMPWGEAERDALKFPFDIGVVPVTAKDMLTWMIAVHMGYDWMVAGDYTFKKLENGKYKKGEFINSYKLGLVGLSDLDDSFELEINDKNSELVPNQNNPWESSQGTFRSFDPTYLIFGEYTWY